jgi:hypothetical protein
VSGRADQQWRVTIVVADVSHSRNPILIAGARNSSAIGDLFEMFDFDRDHDRDQDDRD